ncbi:glucosaminidase domain-containing protein [Salinicoccus sp. HZC-1]|uniref:glucosaminidase domain-containing protein n=1 Tax=Salinicoccus sp. HZC-1 TaxID=3385497 RepID=UPI00398A63A5
MSFLSKIKPHAIAAYSKSGVLPSVLAAQAILETGWGESELAVKANNLFGIKGSYNGQSYTVRTPEQDKNGNQFFIDAAFRKYPSFTESFKDRAAFFTSTPWRTKVYAGVTASKDYKSQVKALDASPYATDKKYGKKLLDIIEENRLYEWDNEINQRSVNVGKVIALDIGHGKNTFPPGKGVYKGGKGYSEFSFNNKLAKRVKGLLEHNGFDVIMAQPFDGNDVSLIRRTNYYDSKRPDLGISLHANAGAAKAGGRCAFYWYTSKQGKQFASNIINNMIDMGYGIHGNGLHASKYNSWTNLHMIRESTTFPMVLVEHGFMTNALDFPLIFGKYQDEYIEDMAECDVKAVCQYFGVAFKNTKSAPSAPPKPSLNKPSVSGSTYTAKKGDTLWAISQAADVSVPDLKSWNNLKSNTISIGQKLRVKKPADKTKKDAPSTDTSELDWQTNEHNTQWAPTEGVWVNGSEPIKKRKGSPKLDAPSTGWMKPGQRLDYREIARSDNHIWLLDKYSPQWTPVKRWNPVTGEVGDDWGDWK